MSDGLGTVTDGLLSYGFSVQNFDTLLSYIAKVDVTPRTFQQWCGHELFCCAESISTITEKHKIWVRKEVVLTHAHLGSSFRNYYTLTEGCTAHCSVLGTGEYHTSLWY